MKNDDPRPIVQKINCDNINNNPPININVDLSDASNGEASSSGDVSQSLSNGDSQTDQRIDRMNANGFSDQKGDFVYTCLNNNTLNVNADISSTTNFNDETTINNNTLFIENNNAQEQLIVQQQEACTNAADINTDDDTGITIGEITGDTTITTSQTTTIGVNQSNNCTVTQDQSATNANQSIADNDSVVLTSSSVANVEQPLEQSQQIKSLEENSGIEIQQQGILPIGIAQQLENSFTEDSSKLTALEKEPDNLSELTATEKIDKLKTQWLNLLP